MKRKIIKIDAKKCNGCGLCVSNCPEGALQLINGKAHLVGELLCDGLGACIGTCPQGAIKIEEREAEKYDENKVISNIVKAGGEAVIFAHLKHLKEHGQKEYLKQAEDYLKKHSIPQYSEEKKTPLPCGCPGTMMQDLRSDKKAPVTEGKKAALGQSQLSQWPIQLHLLTPFAAYFQNSRLVIAADCVPFSFSDFHQRFLKGNILIIFCPKLDKAREIYLEKLSQILINNSIKSITIVHMEVPCCFGTISLVKEALKQSGKKITLKEYTISIKGEIK